MSRPRGATFNAHLVWAEIAGMLATLAMVCYFQGAGFARSFAVWSLAGFGLKVAFKTAAAVAGRSK